ncbi:CesT family type III secretion system chaperone [Pokkaliibacter sp. CJK22405]|uniref:CesT family type III secretion system chaperone n=1 Tax=Pokkaliibacter sp. CJK22405 TaxID=3384615 RepID=UPI003984F20D
MHKAEQLMSELGDRLGIEMKFDQGATELIDMQGHVWHIECSSDSEALLISSEIERDFNDANRMRHWMALNHRFDLTGGAVIALDTVNNRYNLNLLLSLANMRVENLERHLMVMMDVREALLAQPQEKARTTTAAASRPAENQKPLNTNPLSSSSLTMAKLREHGSRV